MLEAGLVLTVDLPALVTNWRTLQAVCGDAECGAVVTADAYGLGLAPVATALAEAGCRTFFVGHVFEGRALRAVLPQAIIYVLNGLRPGTAPTYAELDLRPVLCSVPDMEDWGQFCAVSGARDPNGGPLPSALHLDIGQNRIGLKAFDLERADHLAKLFNLTLLIGQLIAPEAGDEAAILEQIAIFDAMRARFPGKPASIANSAGIFCEANPLYELVRPGLALYGGNPTPGRANPMRPVVRLEAQVIQMRILEPGQSTGDHRRWKAKGPRRIAMIAAGSADGIPAGLTDNARHAGGVALVQGQSCCFVGDIGVDVSVIDVSDAAYLERGELVELLGEKVTLDDFARQAGASPTEILTRLSRRAYRRYRKL